jgi:ketosteroid isomerase-like protein
MSLSRAEMERLVRGYYRAVDNGDVECVLQYFDPSVRYARPGFKVIEGIDDLRHFYEHVRSIQRGEHRIRHVLIDGAVAATHGKFVGVLRNGEEVAVDFADFMTLGATNKIRERSTYFFVPSV